MIALLWRYLDRWERARWLAEAAGGNQAARLKGYISLDDAYKFLGLKPTEDT